MNKWTRRAFIATGSIVGGGLAVGIGGLLVAPNRMSLTPARDDQHSHLTTWIKIAPDNRVTAIVPHCEMGQGVHTALAMMLAEELEADWHTLRIEEAPAEPLYANGYLLPVFVPALGAAPQVLSRGVDFLGFKLTQWMDLQITGGSSSIRGTGQLGMRIAGAAAKAMLLEAAAKRWNVPVGECVARSSKVHHAASDRMLTYGELAVDAAALEPPTRPTLKPKSEYTLVGKPVPRIDTPSKVDGTAVFAIDVVQPGMLFAAVRAAPVFGAKLQSVDARAAEALPGVTKVVQLEDAVAVVAKSYWQALTAVRSLDVSFSSTDNDGASSEALFGEYAATLQSNKGKKASAQGDATKALTAAAKSIEAEYRVPFLAHATMEPMSATARIAEGRCEVWTGVQDPLNARKIAAKAADLDTDKVTLRNHLLGGGFGRRLLGTFDYVDQAVRIAKAMSPAPVKLIWSREEDMQHDFYRPAVIGRFKGGLNSSGEPTAWSAKFNGSGGAAAQVPYAIEHQEIRSISTDTHVRLGAWRSVDHTQHGFFTESFFDELAHAAGQDPYEFRRAHLAHAPRHLAVLEKVATLAGWGSSLPPGHGRGIALVESFGTIVAQAAEVAVKDGAIKVHRVCAAVDCGEIINPDTASAQIEGGIIFGMSAALFGEITIRNGRVEQTNFNDYPLARMTDTPSITIEFIESGAPMGGLGEPGVPPIAPAIANAVFAATALRLRQLPLRLAAQQVTRVEAKG